MVSDFNNEITGFARELIRIKSYSGDEEQVIRLVAAKMTELGYDEVRIDAFGNVLGRIGQGSRSVLFDAHADTVEVKDEPDWEIPPFSGEILDGRLNGRGAVDMKSSVAASVYAGAIARRQGYTDGKTVYVSCTVSEEDCDGENLKHLFQAFSLRPGMVIICEPSNNQITLGHKGKAQMIVKTHGISAHGSAPEKGINAIYEMAEIIQKTEKLNRELAVKPGMRGTVVMSDISSVGASLNAVPSECTAYLDRRLAPGETIDQVRTEMAALTRGKRASWEVDTLRRKSWTGKEIVYTPLHSAWLIPKDHELTRACIRAYHAVFGHDPEEFGFWDFSTNAVTPVSMGIPTIGFGPGDYKLAHMCNEYCDIQQIADACRFYVELIRQV